MCERYPLSLASLQPGCLWATQACALTRNGRGDLSLQSLALNPLSHNGQGATGKFLKNSSVVSSRLIKSQQPVYFSDERSEAEKG